LRESGAESVAVCFLFSYLNPIHEKLIAELLAPLKVPVSLSHEILSEFREFERTSTTVINAYVSPVMKRYISQLRRNRHCGDTLRIMQSNGGSISAGTAMMEPVRTILSGPAGGVVGAFEIGKKAGFDKLITFDMGGTSTDVSMIDGKLSITMESKISDYPVKVPMLDIHTVGAGGGSIASAEPGSPLTVGPESAGADPGPVCYGKGTKITVTDANLYLGRLVPEHFLGGAMKLHDEKIKPFFSKFSKKINLTSLELAEGILSVANSSMERAIRLISVERGYDPSEFTLLTFGGAGGMHAPFLAKLLNIPRVLVPQNPGILSALGMVLADIIKDYSRTVMLDPHDINSTGLQKLFNRLEEQAEDDFDKEGIGQKSVIIERYLDMRYRGQSFEIIVPFDKQYIDRFHHLHEKTYGHRNDGMDIEVVTIRVRARGKPEKPAFYKKRKGPKKITHAAFLGEKDVFFQGTPQRTNIIQRNKLRRGNQIKGPAVVVEYSSTIVVPPFSEAFVDDYGNIVIEIR